MKPVGNDEVVVGNGAFDEHAIGVCFEDLDIATANSEKFWLVFISNQRHQR